MKKTILLCTMTVFLSVWVNGGALDSSSLYVNDPLKWERGLRPGQPTQEFANARIIVVEPEGKLATISCLLYRSPDGGYHIMYTEGYGIASGSWKTAAGNRIMVSLRSIYANVPPVATTKEQYTRESWTYAPADKRGRLASWIKTSESRCVPLQNLSDVKKLEEVIAFHRQESEKK